MRIVLRRMAAYWTSGRYWRMNGDRPVIPQVEVCKVYHVKLIGIGDLQLD